MKKWPSRRSRKRRPLMNQPKAAISSRIMTPIRRGARKKVSKHSSLEVSIKEDEHITSWSMQPVTKIEQNSNNNNCVSHLLTRFYISTPLTHNNERFCWKTPLISAHPWRFEHSDNRKSQCRDRRFTPTSQHMSKFTENFCKLGDIQKTRSEVYTPKSHIQIVKFIDIWILGIDKAVPSFGSNVIFKGTTK
mmetsp:Transcript_19658/g.40539  ORF Transcript_19658/g.40539 Transcript_19658/m.40539 type:complete len:191 (-) Transcript_19658:931-1503(-)